MTNIKKSFNNSSEVIMRRIVILFLLMNMMNCQEPFRPLTVKKDYLDMEEILYGDRINEVPIK